MFQNTELNEIHGRPGISIGSIVQWTSDKKTWTEFNSIRIGSIYGFWETLTSMKDLCNPYHRGQSNDLITIPYLSLFNFYTSD